MDGDLGAAFIVAAVAGVAAVDGEAAEVPCVAGDFASGRFVAFVEGYGAAEDEALGGFVAERAAVFGGLGGFGGFGSNK